MILTMREIDGETALALARAALDHAKSGGREVAVAVVDPAGVPAALLRTDRVARSSVGFAIEKAVTAATLRKSTEALHARAAENPSFRLGMTNRPGLMVWGGGVAIFHGGDCVGGIGVSGARDVEDIECAMAAISRLGLSDTPSA